MKKFGFTLAEVLIVLVVIGVVAAITIPIIISNYQKQQTVSSLQKAFSTISQAAKMAENDYGPMPTWNPPATDFDIPVSKTWFDAYSLIPYLSVIKTCTGGVSADVAGCWAKDAKYLDGASIGYGATLPCVLLNDGSSIYFTFVSSLGAFMLVDINGPSKKPNIDGKDIFRIVIRYPQNNVEFYGRGNIRSSNLTNDAFGGCNKTSGQQKGDFCGAIIQSDGWKISDDYPWD